ncbi:putative transcription factor bHLH family [Helianthus annuus]|uniref:Putative achaete-scute transcription factor-related protein n=1 Tax=Helianthus annuus TaxID=4232 RepID=A0A251TKY6_HELAN|nr:putative transcription factor bHLH family [Helianthus annuus]KAJ0626210.1 putative transcription factor bHLH family [Helianthus annuus]KAJ0782542.1 putative transcription factor bHLH family [Helianthus annuus]KAJ0807074.1 putative transcription factor bHLH family [Helianthus annuus]KAJ0947147.1 putative transcription factor bHLH family [Helianthus annuus]
MLALSPPLFSTTYGWPFDGLITQNLQQDCNEANSYNPLLDCPSNIQIQHDFAPENSLSMSSKEAVNGNNDDPMKVAKKLNHNASERDRRKRVNELYSFLRSLLPLSTDRTKKVSIPGIVSRALKYIPELQQEVERLKNKKEKLLLRSSSTNIRNFTKETMIQNTSSVVSSVSVLGEKDVVIQLIYSFDDTNKNKIKDIALLSKALEYLEEEEDNLVLLSVTTFKCLEEKRLLNTLHFQVHNIYTSHSLFYKLKTFSSVLFLEFYLFIFGNRLFRNENGTSSTCLLEHLVLLGSSYPWEGTHCKFDMYF